MRKILLLIALSIGLSQLALGQARWVADPFHSNVRFSVEHLGISFVDGQFTEFNGEVKSNSETDFEGATFNFTIDVNSIDTRVKDRDNHLKSDDFFNAEEFPLITLRNAKLFKKDDEHYKLKGDLTIRDVTKTVVFEVEQNNGVITDPWDNKRVGFTASLTIDRTEFNVNYSGKLPSGVDEVGKKVKIVVNTELIKQ